MKLPPVRKLTKKQAEKYLQAILVAYPEIGRLLQDTACVSPTKLSKSQERLRPAEVRAFNEGMQQGRKSQESEIAGLKAKLESRQHRLEALKVLTSYCSTTGQTMQAFCRAMESEAGQL